MKKLYTIVASLLAMSAFFVNAAAQVAAPIPYIYGASPFQDSLWGIDSTLANWLVSHRIAPSLSGFTITGINGLAYDPCGYQTYAILKVSGVSGRVLATIDLDNGVCTQIGNLGTNFSSLTFDKTGQLYGQTGDGASPAETFFSINKATGATTQLATLGNGADGEVICYNYASDKMYHWSGNGTVVYEKFRYTAPYTVTSITSGGGSGEIFGSMYLGPNRFLVSTINSNFRYVDTLGAYSASFASLPDDWRGLVMVPKFAISDDTICAEQSIQIAASGSLVHNMYYNWGDGTIDTVAMNASASHQYNTAGNYTLSVILDNGTCSGTAFSKAIRVNALPVVTVSGSTALCPNGTVTLTASGGGTSQWYLNGSPISGATSNTYNADTAGIYNMVKTNMNGCSDSADVGITVINVPSPSVNLGADASFCGSATLDAQNAGANYLWSNAATTQTISPTSSGTYSVLVTDSNNCSASDTITITVNAIPTVSYTQATNFACTYSGNITLAGGVPAGGTYSGTQVSGTTFNPAAAGVGSYTITYTFTDGNNCTNSATSQITVSACAGIYESIEMAPVKVYPNPSDGLFTITLNDMDWKGAVAKVIDVTGKTVQQINITQNSSPVNLTEVSNGVYLLQLKLNDRTYTTQIIKN